MAPDHRFLSHTDALVHNSRPVTQPLDAVVTGTCLGLLRSALLLWLAAGIPTASRAERAAAVSRIADVLTALQQNADADRIIRLFPVQGERLGDGYNITAPIPGVKQVIVNLQRETHRLSASPESVEFLFTETQARPLGEVVPFCKEWKELPSQRTKPWFYVCSPTTQGKMPVAVYASLMGDIHGPNARVLELRLQTGL